MWIDQTKWSVLKKFVGEDWDSYGYYSRNGWYLQD
jgi:hypothetical protein